MPKGGRRPHESQLNYLFPSEAWNMTKNAPFGTFDTPPMKVKLIAGRPYMVQEDFREKNLTSREPPPPNNQIVLNPRPFDPNKINTYPASVYKGNGPQDESPHTSPRRQIFSPHRVLPPIGSDLDRRLPLTSMLPTHPLKLTEEEHFELRKRLRDDLEAFNPDKLKEIYVDLSASDISLCGCMKYNDLSFCLLKHQAAIGTNTLRLVCSLFVDEAEPSVVNYEKVLSYLAGSLRERGQPPSLNISQQLQDSPRRQTHAPVRPPTYDDGDRDGPDFRRHHRMEQQQDDRVNPQQGMYYNPLLHTVEDYSTNSDKYPYGDKDVAKLLRLVEEHLDHPEASDMMPMDQIWSMFRMADRDHRGKLSREQIKGISTACRIPLSSSLMNQLIDRCDISNGQFNWQQYLEFIERVHPVKTGLNIPPSKKPSDFAKHVPKPSTNWPLQETPQPVAPRVDRYHNRQGSPDRRKADPFRSAPLNMPMEEEDDEDVGIRNVENKLKHLEQQHNKDRIELMKAGADRNSQKWFERFMKLANALYVNDANSAGWLPYNDTRWLINEFNDTYALHIPPSEIVQTLDDCCDSGKVHIDSVLRRLGKPAPS